LASHAELTADELALLGNMREGAMFSHLVWLPSASDPRPDTAAAIVLDFLTRGWVDIYEVELAEPGTESQQGERLLPPEEAELAIRNSGNWVIADPEGVAPYEARASAAGLAALAKAG
jgi:hypothetical protein